MKTEKVIPILIKNKDIQSSVIMLGCTQNWCQLTTDVIDDEEWLKFGKPHNLILISLEDQKIKVGDMCYNTFHTNEGFIIVDDVEYYNKRNHYKKVIATQDILSPELIEDLVDEYNSGGMKDFEIEMEEIFTIDSILSESFYQPKLTNGFVTVINKPKDDLYCWFYSHDIKWRYDAIQRHYPKFTGELTEDMIKHIYNKHNKKTDTPKKECIHPFKRLHWIDSTVFCNACKTTLHTSNNPVLYTENEVRNMLIQCNCLSVIEKDFDIEDWFTKNKR